MDDKAIAVPTEKVDPTYAGVDDIEDLPALERERLAEFFASYKKIPTGSKVVVVHGFEGASAARLAFEAARERYEETRAAGGASAVATGR